MHQMQNLLHELYASHDRHCQIAHARYEMLSQLWNTLVEKLTHRCTIAQSYIDFQQQADQVNNVFNLSCMLYIRQVVKILSFLLFTALQWLIKYR
jgi:hypothetical protein